jgi:hypothetical protein
MDQIEIHPETFIGIDSPVPNSVCFGDEIYGQMDTVSCDVFILYLMQTTQNSPGITDLMVWQIMILKLTLLLRIPCQ